MDITSNRVIRVLKIDSVLTILYQSSLMADLQNTLNCKGRLPVSAASLSLRGFSFALHAHCIWPLKKIPTVHFPGSSIILVILLSAHSIYVALEKI
jgi:hypothetical protein